MSITQPCRECTERAARVSESVSWTCGMFACSSGGRDCDCWRDGDETQVAS